MGEPTTRFFFTPGLLGQNPLIPACIRSGYQSAPMTQSRAKCFRPDHLPIRVIDQTEPLGACLEARERIKCEIGARRLAPVVS